MRTVVVRRMSFSIILCPLAICDIIAMRKVCKRFQRLSRAKQFWPVVLPKRRSSRHWHSRLPPTEVCPPAGRPLCSLLARPRLWWLSSCVSAILTSCRTFCRLSSAWTRCHLGSSHPRRSLVVVCHVRRRFLRVCMSSDLRIVFSVPAYPPWLKSLRRTARGHLRQNDSLEPRVLRRSRCRICSPHPISKTIHRGHCGQFDMAQLLDRP
ncbi:hypothetical protein BXZ70DRAFT_673336 [Cristinia sonorae]|uniref:Uncharacterized protein n=1 Tax=Cristinia sonorae TaxID=1940300 RepID=A0A8K0UUW7_9AGAR|nr:hypothetical protein BXZ70DRAFT_673336 [Cristinia sonorae]